MNKLFNLGAMLTIAAGAMMVNSSCSSNDMPEYNGGEIVKANYETAFVNTFGKPAPNQTWGFGDFSKGVKSGATRGHNADANMWAGAGWNVPATLTDAQKDIVRQYFQQVKNPVGIAINYTDFFVQDVYKGGTNLADAQTTEKYKAANGDEFFGSDKMNKLTAGSGNDHINNYNDAKCTANTEVWNGTLSDPTNPNAKNFHTDKIMLMVDSKTDCFGYYNSLNSIQHNDQYVIISGTTIMEWAKANNKKLNGADISGMYFVGFDYDAPIEDITDTKETSRWLGTPVNEGTPNAIQKEVEENGNKKTYWYVEGATYVAERGYYLVTKPDGYYSDWIVRIKPGIDETPEITPIGAVRVIAEDLSATSGSDFDFNDVVFDVKLGYPNANQTTIILQAAGGTLPLTVADIEVHEAFGVETNQMVNTGAGPEVSPKEIILNTAYTNAIDIPVKVLKNGEWIELTAERAEAAAKIGVPTSFEWCQERVNITTVYPLFKDYVTSTDWKDIVWWEK